MTHATAVAPASAGIARAGAGASPVPAILRDGIRWRDGVQGPLRIELSFENPASVPSAPTEARIGIAGFGAFLPWQPLTTAPVPAIPPGGRVVVPSTAAGDLPRPPGDGRRPAQLRLPGFPAPALSRRQPAGFGGAIARLLAAASRTPQNIESLHFVGNLNVFVTRSAPVERHVQRAIGLQTGAANLTMFLVGDGRRDRYAFRLEADPGWEVEIEPVGWDRPFASSHCMVTACIRPPAKAESGRVAIHVRRDSTGEEVPVEFELETRAPGARCYFFR